MQLRTWGLALGAAAAAACGGKSGRAPDAAPPIDAVPIDAAPDASPFVSNVHGTITVLNTVNDATGAPVPDAGAPDPASTHLSVTRADGTTDLVTLAADGTFGFGLNAVGQKYRLTVAIDGQVKRDFASDQTTLTLGFIGAGRNPRDPVVSEIVIKAVFDNWVDGDEAILASTGLWTATEQELVTNPPVNQTEPWAFSWTWSTASSLSGGVGLLDANQHDALQLTEWHTVTTPDTYQSITAALVHTDITMMNGSDIELGADDAPIPITATPQRCAHVVAPRKTELARIAAAVPDTYEGALTNWELQAPAGDGIGPTGAQTVAIGGANGSGSNADYTVSFGSPFGGAKLIAATTAKEIREIHAVSGDDGLFLQAGTQSWVETDMPATGCTGTAPMVNPAPTVAIPSVPSLGSAVLDTDDANLELALTGDLTVTWTQAATGVADEYVVTLVEIGESNQQTTATSLYSVFTTEESATFDASLLQTNHTYMFEVFARQGFPNAAAGDFRTISFPFANSVTLSHTFKPIESTI